MKLDWNKIGSKTKAVQVDETIVRKIVNKDPATDEIQAEEMTLAEAKVYKPTAKAGEKLELDTLWHFYFPDVEGLPQIMGEHGKTVDEAWTRVIKRLEAMEG